MSKSDTGRRVLGIDPGPTKCGIVLYVDGKVTLSDNADVETVLQTLRDLGSMAALEHGQEAVHVAVERCSSYAGGSLPALQHLLPTAEVYGEIRRRALDSGLTFSGHRRRDVLTHLRIAGRAKDSQVRAVLAELHGCDTLQQAKGTKANPGVLYGVSGHAWQALAVAVTALAVLS